MSTAPFFYSENPNFRNLSSIESKSFHKSYSTGPLDQGRKNDCEAFEEDLFFPLCTDRLNEGFDALGKKCAISR